ncbi:MAG: 4-hydroxybenzoate octaprenyltransferase [Cohaesibacter sp.]|nr:4-hydroxybenzoate octaprenyltransferase [Cohaesibacter sp.]MCV6601106.1 4-hydroxybenzoate octaprenyltransferase [Cohaesibacter sp.]
MTNQAQQKKPDDEIEGRVADAVRGHWADHYLPVWFRPYARLSRLERPIGWWLLLWPCLWSLALAMAAGHRYFGGDMPISLSTALYYTGLFWIGAVAMRGAGCTYNDIVDHKIDAKVERTRSRPLPSGQVSRKQAWLWLALQLLAGLIVLLQFNPYTQILGLSSLIVVAAYPFMKRITHWPQFVLGLAFSWGGVMGWAAVYGSLDFAPIMLYIACVVWTIGYDTIYAHQDKEDDALIGVKSTALLFGEKTKLWLAFFYGVMIVLMVVAFVSVDLGPFIWIGLCLAIAHLARQIITLDMNDADQCLALFKSNTNIGFMILSGLLIEIWV